MHRLRPWLFRQQNGLAQPQRLHSVPQRDLQRRPRLGRVPGLPRWVREQHTGRHELVRLRQLRCRFVLERCGLRRLLPVPGRLIFQLRRRRELLSLLIWGLSGSGGPDNVRGLRQRNDDELHRLYVGLAVRVALSRRHDVPGRARRFVPDRCLLPRRRHKLHALPSRDLGRGGGPGGPDVQRELRRWLFRKRVGTHEPGGRVLSLSRRVYFHLCRRDAVLRLRAGLVRRRGGPPRVHALCGRDILERARGCLQCHLRQLPSWSLQRGRGEHNNWLRILPRGLRLVGRVRYVPGKLQRLRARAVFRDNGACCVLSLLPWVLRRRPEQYRLYTMPPQLLAVPSRAVDMQLLWRWLHDERARLHGLHAVQLRALQPGDVLR